MIDSIFNIGNPLLLLSIFLISGFSLGYIAKKMRLPSLLGQICAGILIGPYFLDLIKPEIQSTFYYITDFALCLFGLSLGTHLILRKLHNAGKRIFFILICEIIFVPLIIFIALFVFLKIPLPQSILLSVIGLTTSPGAIIRLIQENRSKGIYTKTLVTTVALNSIVSLTLFSIALQIVLSMKSRTELLTVTNVMFSPFKELFGAVLLGSIMAFPLLILTRKWTSITYYFSLIIIIIIMIAGISQILNIQGFLASMVFGFIISNYSTKKHFLQKSLKNIESGIYVLFFVLAGTYFDFKMIPEAGLTGIIFILARALGKYIAPTIGAYLSMSSQTIKKCMGISLLPQEGIAIGFVLIISNYSEFSDISGFIATISMCSIIVFSIIGPLFTDMAIELSGEKNKSQSRLLNFLQEEYILVGLQSTNKWEALEELATFLHRVHGIREITREQLIQSIMDREKEMSTGIGEGVAVPHAIIEGGPKIRGVIGISHKGIDYNAIDGNPVNLVILVATPRAHYDQHLNVLASIAKIFGHDPETKNHIFKAKTPAEVHEILQTGNPDAFNIYREV